MAAGSGISAPKPDAGVDEVWAFARELQNAYFEEKQSRKDWANEAASYRMALQTFIESVERDRREPDKILCHVASARRVTASAEVQGDPS
jgi:hypothetical protein